MTYQYGGSEKEERERKEQVPPGEHEFMIESVDEQVSSTGNNMVVFSLKCMDAGKENTYWTIRHFLVLGNEYTDQNIGDMMDALGKNRVAGCEIDWFQWKGEYLSAKTKMKKYEEKEYATIHYFLDARATTEEIANPGVPASDAKTIKDSDVPF